MRDYESAFPLPCCDVDLNGPTAHWGQKGMTLRDYFAAAALPAVLRAAIALRVGQDDKPFLAMVSYQMADAMLAERAKGE